MNRVALLLCGLLFLTSCSDDNPASPDSPPALVARAGENQQARINETVTLDGTASTGPEGFTYSWTYSGDIPESQINFQNRTSATPTFVPPSAGVYSFTLTIQYQGVRDSDQTTVGVGGALEIGGTLTADLALKNIQPDASQPDYVVKSDLIVPAGITLSIIEDDVIIAFDAGTGIHVQGGTLTNVIPGEDYTFRTEFTGSGSWKGIWVENGTLNVKQASFVNAGSSTFAGQVEASAITLSGTQTNLVSFSDNSFVNSSSHDILVTDRFPEVYASVRSNRFSARVPIKAPITFVGFWTSDYPNIMPASYDYIHLIPGGAQTMDVLGTVNGFPNVFALYPKGATFFIDGDFWAGSTIIPGEGTTILMRENAGVVPDSGLSSRGDAGREITWKGIDGKSWKGFALRRIGALFNSTIVENAGSGTMNIGGMVTTEPAAIYSTAIASAAALLRDCRIVNSGGYGYYNDLSTLVSEPIQRTHFQNTAKAAIRTNLVSANEIIRGADHGNTFQLAPGVPAVLVQDSDLEPVGVWYGLGGESYYLIDADWTQYGDVVLNAGVHLKFKSGRAFVRGSNTSESYLVILGEPGKPVIMDGETGTPGSWGGLMLRGGYRIEYLDIRNGGQYVLPDATEKANVVSSFVQSYSDKLKFENCSVSNSAGWGAVVESGTYNIGFDDPAKNNSFSSNASGDVLVKP